MSWLPEFTPDELKKLDPDLLAFLQDKSLWQEWDKVIVPANKLLWNYFEEAIGIPEFYEGAKDASEEYKKFEGAWRPPEGYDSWTGGTNYADAYFKERGVEFVKQISDTDRQKLKNLLVKHWGVGEREFAKKIKEEYLFSPARAKAIYRNETHLTHEAGGYSFAADHGVESKAWLANQKGVCDLCIGYSEGMKIIPLNQPFSNGGQFAHGHVGCRCTTLYYMDDISTAGGKARADLSKGAFEAWQKGGAAGQTKYLQELGIA